VALFVYFHLTLDYLKNTFTYMTSKQIANCLIILGSFAFLFGLIAFGFNRGEWSAELPIDSSLLSNLGSFLSGTVGGLWALASVFYFIQALSEQRKEIEDNHHLASIQRFETTFFQLLQSYSNTVNELKYKLDGSAGEGREVFTYWKDSLDEMAQAKGVDRIHDGYGGTTVTSKPQIDDKEEFEKFLNEVYYKVHYHKFEDSLNHYFRQLYHIFKYIHESELIKDDQRQFYASLLRAQLSQNELYAIAVNAVIPEYGRKKFLPLIKRYDILKNFNHKVIPPSIMWEYIKDITTKVNDTN